MLTLGHAHYQTPRKPLPKWLFDVLFWSIIPPLIVAMMAWEVIIKPLWQAVTRPVLSPIEIIEDGQ